MSDTSSGTTVLGGVELADDLLRGARNYACNPADLTTETEVKGIKKKLIAQLDQTIEDLEEERKIAKIYIGKTFIRRRRIQGGGFKTFEPLDHHTWRKNGISSRWQVHKHEYYGRDGLVVLGAITRETMPERCRGQVHQEDFALAMEQKLLHHYILSHPDPRVVNESFSTGQATKDKCYAYAVYMAFRYEGEPLSTMCQYLEPGPSHTPPPLSDANSPPDTKRCSPSLRQTQPAPDFFTQHAISSTACFIEQQAAGREADIQQTSPTMKDSGTEPGTPTRPMASSSTKFHHRKHKQTESLQMSEAGPSHMQSRVPSRTRSSRPKVRFEQDSQSNLMLQRFRFTG